MGCKMHSLCHIVPVIIIIDIIYVIAAATVVEMMMADPTIDVFGLPQGTSSIITRSSQRFSVPPNINILCLARKG
jgi:hypothetical protein